MWHTVCLLVKVHLCMLCLSNCWHLVAYGFLYHKCFSQESVSWSRRCFTHHSKQLTKSNKPDSFASLLEIKLTHCPCPRPCIFKPYKVRFAFAQVVVHRLRASLQGVGTAWKGSYEESQSVRSVCLLRKGPKQKGFSLSFLPVLHEELFKSLPHDVIWPYGSFKKCSGSFTAAWGEISLTTRKSLVYLRLGEPGCKLPTSWVVPKTLVRLFNRKSCQKWGQISYVLPLRRYIICVNLLETALPADFDPQPNRCCMLQASSFDLGGWKEVSTFTLQPSHCPPECCPAWPMSRKWKFNVLGLCLTAFWYYSYWFLVDLVVGFLILHVYLLLVDLGSAAPRQPSTFAVRSAVSIFARSLRESFAFLADVPGSRRLSFLEVLQKMKFALST